MRLMLGGNLEVAWQLLLDSYLNSTEKATVRLVQAVFRVEGKGGLPRRVHAAVRELLSDLCPEKEQRP
jgi:hypothetical protein